MEWTTGTGTRPSGPASRALCGTPYQSASRVAARAGGIQLPSPLEPGNRRAQGSGRRSRFLKLWGAPAWWLWGLVHVGFLMGLRNRVTAMTNWLWAYLTFGSGIRLITEGDTWPPTDRRPLPDARSR